MTLLSLQRLQRSFGGVRAVDGVSFDVAPGEIVALIGPNGAGKSTLLNLIDGQLAPEGGRIAFDGNALVKQSTAERTRRGIGRTFQVAQTFSSMTTLQSVQLALVSADGGAMDIGRLLWNLHSDAAHDLLSHTGLQSKASLATSGLAYGDVKRLELALALAGKPRLLLMDEPTAGMAAAERFALMQLVIERARDSKLAVLFTEHSMDVVFGFAHRVLVMSRGQLIADGSPAAVRADAEVQRVYLGEDA